MTLLNKKQFLKHQSKEPCPEPATVLYTEKGMDFADRLLIESSHLPASNHLPVSELFHLPAKCLQYKREFKYLVKEVVRITE